MSRNEPKVEEDSFLNGEHHFTILYSLFQKVDKDLNIAIELKHEDKEKKFGMVFGAIYSKFENVICRAKIDENFGLSSSF